MGGRDQDGGATWRLRARRRSSPLALRAVAAVGAQAQDYPNKPIRMIVPYPPGGGTDVVARILNEKLAPELGQPIVIDNKGGAGGNVGTELAAKATPDGYTVLFTLSSHTINPEALPKLRYDVERDFIPVSLAALDPADPRRPPDRCRRTTCRSWSRSLKANPGQVQLRVGRHRLARPHRRRALQAKTGVQMTHVPYKGGGPAVTDTIGGQVQLLFVSMPAALQHVKQGRLKALAVTSAKRSVVGARRADDRRARRAGRRRRLVVRRCSCRRRRRAPVVAKLNAAMVKVLRDARGEARSCSRRAPKRSSVDAAEFDAIIRDELKKWEYVIREAKITPE